MVCGYHIGEYSRVANICQIEGLKCYLCPHSLVKNILLLYRKNTLLLKLWAQNMEWGSQSLAPSPTVDSGLRPSQKETLPTQAITFIFQEARAEFLQG